MSHLCVGKYTHDVLFYLTRKILVMQEGSLDRSDLTILEQIAKRVVASLEHDDQFSGDLVREITRLFESGDVANQAKVLKILEGDPSEDPQPRD